MRFFDTVKKDALVENDNQNNYNDPYVFSRPENEYQIRLSPVNEYIKQASAFLSKTKNISMDKARATVKRMLTAHGVKNPIVTFNHKQENGDMLEETEPLTNYIKNVVSDGEVLVPSFTSYMHPSIQKSIHADFLSINIAARKADKHAAFEAKQLGNVNKATYHTVMQKVRKIFNNSLSGAYASKSTVLYNPSAHYTLTSITRCVASIGNAISESIIAGNKHFRTPDTVLNYISAIITNVNLETAEIVVERYKLHKPTAEEAHATILYSSRNYWTDLKEEEIILNLLKKLNPIELCVVVYTNDLWHLKHFNPDFMHNMVERISKKVPTGSINHLSDLNNAGPGVANLVHHICMDEIKGMSINYKDLIGTELLDMLASTARNISLELQNYKLLFRTFLASDIMPIDIAFIVDMLRDAIVLSDTDSTCGSYDKWVEWFFGKPDFTAKGVAVSATIMSINIQAMDHHLKLFARNMNIDKNLVDLLKMKNEYFWTVFTAANINKHYFANTIIQEGNVFEKSERELKGVHFISSSIDQALVVRFNAMIDEIHTTITNGKKIELYKYVKQVADMERELIEKVKNGDISIYKKDKIKNAAGYKLEKEKSPYINHMLWKEVFSEKYGYPGEPMYMVIKVPLKINSPTDLRLFLSEIKDTELRDKWISFLARLDKDAVGTFRPPLAIVSTRGIPEEVIPVIDVERVILDNLGTGYLILESIGYFRKSKMLLSEMGY